MELDKNTQELLNAKLAQMRNDFNAILNNLSERNQELQVTIHKFRRMNKEFLDNPNFINIDGMDVKSAVDKLLVVTEDPKEIWSEINN